MQLEGGTHFLLLRRAADYNNHSVLTFRRYDDVLTKWQTGDRVSPISPINNAALPELADGTVRSIHFLGPIHPGKVTCPGKIYLSLGLFNIIIITESIEESEKAATFCGSCGCNWEKWNLLGNKIDTIMYSQPSIAPDAGIPNSVLLPIKLPYEELKGTVFEYRALIASTIGRAATFISPTAKELQRFDTIFRELLVNKKMTYDSISKHGLLTIANAAMSRYSSQTFAGTSPILETESHVWSHSLLGLGIASLALRRIREFIETVFSSAGIFERLKLLSNVNAAPNPLYSIASNDSFWEKDFLHDYAPQKAFAPKEEHIRDNPPLITCFSGRDGFRSTQISLSAPLAVISGCNTTSWTLLTLTHEMSHTIVDGVLGLLLPNPDKETELTEAVALLKETQTRNMFDALRQMLCFAFWTAEGEGKLQEGIDEKRLAAIIRTMGIEINEILTHVFDFLYFYRKDQVHYVRSIWSSWGVIPNISHRIPDYINRTLCALHSNNLRRKDSYDITIDQLNDCLIKTMELYPETPYIKDAILQLRHNRAQYKQALKNRALFVKFVRYFLYSPTIESMITREPDVTGGERGGYPLKVSEFTDTVVHNPLRFIEEFSRDKMPDKQRSIWMLQQLAFGVEV